MLDKLKGIGTPLILAAVVVGVTAFVVPRMPIQGIFLGAALLIGAVLIGSKLPHPVGLGLGVVGGMIIITALLQGTVSTSLNKASPQAITMSQMKDPVARSFLS